MSEQKRNPDGTFTSHVSVYERLAACEDAGLPLRLAGRINGQTAEELATDAQALREELAAQKPASTGGWLERAMGRGQPAPAQEPEPGQPVTTGSGTFTQRIRDHLYPRQ